jgi:hypothetical protein
VPITPGVALPMALRRFEGVAVWTIVSAGQQVTAVTAFGQSALRVPLPQRLPVLSRISTRWPASCTACSAASHTANPPSVVSSTIPMTRVCRCARRDDLQPSGDAGQANRLTVDRGASQARHGVVSDGLGMGQRHTYRVTGSWLDVGL